jgi:hypothetical protein
VADLPGNVLGRVVGGTRIVIDVNAVGRGWFVDASASEDSEFTRRPRTDELTARRGTAARDRVDLLTAVMHELGHVLGEDHDATGVMQDALRPGTRRLWDRAVDEAFAGRSI